MHHLHGVRLVYLLVWVHGIVCPPALPSLITSSTPSSSLSSSTDKPVILNQAAHPESPNGYAPGDSPLDQAANKSNVFDEYGLEYGKYLMQVVNVLEKDKEFAARLENATLDDVQSGKISEQLHFVNHDVRSKLDELKRIEMNRLHDVTKKLNHLESKNVVKDHIDHKNPLSFEMEDLNKLLLKTRSDLVELDRKEEEKFKEHQMRKELNYRATLAQANETERARLIKEHDDNLRKHQDHPQVHHPGSKAQLEQVWEEQDGLPGSEFDPKTFFALHDINSDGFWDPQEVEALLTLEIKKLYDPKHNPEAEDDPEEMMAEYHRMRGEIYKEMDPNKDGLIARKEFLDFASGPEFVAAEKKGWQEIDEKKHPEYTEAELEQYYRAHHEEMQRQQHQAHMHHLQQQQHMMHQQQQMQYQMQQGGHPNPHQYYYYDGSNHEAPPPQHYYAQHPGQGPPIQYDMNHPPPNQQYYQQHPGQHQGFIGQQQNMGHPQIQQQQQQQQQQGFIGQGHPQIQQQVPQIGHQQQQQQQPQVGQVQQRPPQQQQQQQQPQQGFIGQAPNGQHPQAVNQQYYAQPNGQQQQQQQPPPQKVH